MTLIKINIGTDRRGPLRTGGKRDQTRADHRHAVRLLRAQRCFILTRGADVLVENLVPGAMDRMSLTWEHIPSSNPKIAFGSVKGFADRSVPAQLLRTPVNEVVLPGAAWLSYSVGAGAGASAAAWFHWPLLAPIVVLLMLTNLLTVGV